MEIYSIEGIVVLGVQRAELKDIKIENIEEFTSCDTPAMAVSTNAELSATILDAVGGSVKDLDPRYLILVNKSVIRNPKAWNACISHELGHIRNGDLDGEQEPGRHLEKEIAADDYACAQGHGQGTALLLRQLIVIVWINKLFSRGEAKMRLKDSMAELKTRLANVKQKMNTQEQS